MKKSILYLATSALCALSVSILFLWITSTENLAKYKAYALTTMANNIKDADNMQALRLMQKAFRITKADSILQHKMEEIWENRGFNPFHIGPFITPQKSLDNFISPSGKYIIYPADSLGIFEFSTQQVINHLEISSAHIDRIYFVPSNDSLVIIKDYDNCLTVWNFVSDKTIFQRAIHPENIRVNFSDNNVLIDSEKEIIWLQLNTLKTRSYFRDQSFAFYDMGNISGFLGKDKLYYITHESVYIHELTGENKYSIRGDDSLTSATASDSKLLIQTHKGITLYHFYGKPINTIYNGAVKDAIAAFSPDGQHILLESKHAVAGFNASLWDHNGVRIRHYDYPSAKFSATGRYIMLLKWVKEDVYYVQKKRLETLNGIRKDSSNGLLLTDNDQYLVTIPQLKVKNLETNDTTFIKINHGITADSIKEYIPSNNPDYASLNTAYAGTLTLIATADSKYLIMDQHYKDHMLENEDGPLALSINNRNFSIYNFSTGKQFELLQGKERGGYAYTPQSEKLVYRNISFFQYWDLRYLSHFPSSFKLKNAQDIYNYLDSSKFFPPLNSKYENF